MPRTSFRTVLALLAVLAATTAHAQMFRAYLSSEGSDANPCTLQQPCRLLPAALTAVASGGEIWMMDGANYNTSTVFITKSVSIVAMPGVLGSVVALGGGPAISITMAGLKVALRDISVVPVAGSPPGTYGVRMSVASSLVLDRCVISGMLLGGLLVEGSGTVQVANSVFRHNNPYALRASNGARVNITSTQFLDNASGIYLTSSLDTSSTLTLSDSVISGGVEGAYAYAGGPGSFTRIAIARSTIERTTYALDTESANGGTSTISVSGSTIAHNANGWYVVGAPDARVQTLGNNQFFGNSTQVGVLTPSPPQ